MVCVLGSEGSRVFASTALVVLTSSMDGYVSGHNDYATSFHEPFLPHYNLIFACIDGMIILYIPSN